MKTSPSTPPRLLQLPENGSFQTQEVDREYLAKRTKTGNSKQFPMSKLLATLDKPQLLALINNLIDAHPRIQSEIESSIPRPTVQSVTSAIAVLEKKLQDSFPYSKFGPSRDDYSYNRVKPAIVELSEALEDYAAHFASAQEFPTTTFSYLHLACTVAHRLPNWDREDNNEIKRHLYIKLCEYWHKVIVDAASKMSQGKIYGQAVVGEWARNLAQHNQESNGAFQPAVEEFKSKLGWIIGIHPPPNAAKYGTGFSHQTPMMPVSVFGRRS